VLRAALRAIFSAIFFASVALRFPAGVSLLELICGGAVVVGGPLGAGGSSCGRCRGRSLRRVLVTPAGFNGDEGHSEH
jgi:hypothetical protein